jgi:4-hydroxybenzoate polyprenyltransferase
LGRPDFVPWSYFRERARQPINWLILLLPVALGLRVSGANSLLVFMA